MKKYVFITARISNMGGAENYLCCKKHWLEQNGWDVIVIHYRSGPVLLPWFDNGTIHMECIKYPVYYYNRRKAEIILRQLESVINDKEYEEVVIESTIVDISTWGEGVASRIQAKHVLYSLQEENLIQNESIKEYMRFKCSRNEVRCINKKSAKFLLDSANIANIGPDAIVLSAYNVSPVADYGYDLCATIETKSKDYVIGSVGRLDKPYVIPMVKAIVDYVQKDTNHQYILLLIGGGDDRFGALDKIEKLCTGIGNLHLYTTGYIYPIPLKLFRLCNIMISSSGSANVCREQGIPTISMDALDGMPIGVVGYTTENRLYRENEPILPLSWYLDAVLKRKEYSITSPIPSKEPDYCRHLEFIENSSHVNSYYDMFKIKWDTKYWIQRILMPLIGPKLFHKILYLFRDNRGIV